jgi:hypothetical protein
MKLLSLLDPTDLDQKIMIAELHRTLGDFQACIDIIKDIDEEDLKGLKEKFIMECKRKNRRVFELN